MEVTAMNMCSDDDYEPLSTSFNCADMVVLDSVPVNARREIVDYITDYQGHVDIRINILFKDVVWVKYNL
jgi:hypothetical protein